MKSVVKLVGISSCCLVGSINAANAEPTVLADAELDRVAAGYSCLAGTDCPYPPSSRGLIRNFGLSPLPFHFAPDTDPLPGFTPDAIPSFGPIIWPLSHEYCGPFCDPGPAAGAAGG